MQFLFNQTIKYIGFVSIASIQTFNISVKKLSTRFFLALVIAATLPFQAQAQAKNETANHLIKTSEDVAIYLDKLETYTANFKQVVYQNNKQIQESAGNVTLKKPIKFKWDYQTPNAMQILSDGKNLFQYDIKLKQATVKPIKDLGNTGILSLLKENTKINKLFKITKLNDAELSKLSKSSINSKNIDNKLAYFLLKPKDINQKTDAEETKDQYVILGFNQNNLSFILFSDNYGVTDFYFTNIKINQPIAEQTFKLIVPAGVDILGDII